MSISLRALVGASLTLAVALCASASESPLTLASAQRLALERSRSLPAQEYAGSAAREMAAAARQLPDPVLKAGIDNLPLSGADRFSLGADFMTMRRIGISQELTSANKRRWRAERYEAEAGKALAMKNAAAASIERDAALAWLDLYFALKAGEVLRTMETQATLEREALLSAFRAKHASLGDQLSAQAAQVQLAERRIDADRRIRLARLVLERWAGSAASGELAGLPEMEHEHGVPPASHPHLEAMRRDADIARSEAELARANTHPDWTVEIGLQQRGPAYTNMLSFGISVPLQWDQARRQRREVAARQATLQQAEAETEEAQREFNAAANAQLEEWHASVARATLYRDTTWPLAQQRLEAVLAQYRSGAASLAEVLGARRNELDVRLQGVEADAAAARAWVQMNYYHRAGGLQ